MEGRSQQVVRLNLQLRRRGGSVNLRYHIGYNSYPAGQPVSLIAQV